MPILMLPLAVRGPLLFFLLPRGCGSLSHQFLRSWQIVSMLPRRVWSWCWMIGAHFDFLGLWERLVCSVFCAASLTLHFDQLTSALSRESGSTIEKVRCLVRWQTRELTLRALRPAALCWRVRIEMQRSCRTWMPSGRLRLRRRMLHFSTVLSLALCVFRARLRRQWLRRSVVR